MNAKKRKNGKIELMRFVFTMCVLLFHFNRGLWDGKKGITESISFFAKGNICVEFFFLVSGFLMAKTLHSQLQREAAHPELAAENAGEGIGDATLRFLWHKVKGILPYQWAFSAIMAVFLCLSKPETMPDGILKKLPSLLLLNRTGIMADSASFLRVDWYLSSMLIAMAILYPLCRRFGKTFTRLVAPLSALLILGYMMYTVGELGGGSRWDGLTFHCNLRALAEIALGATCYEVYTVMSKRTFSRFQQLLISITELACYLITLRYVCSFASSKYHTDIVLLLCVAITLSFSQKGLLGESRLFQNSVCEFLGAISLPVYLCQIIIREGVIYYLPNLQPKCQCLLMVIMTLALGIVSYLIVSSVQRRKARAARA
ncbi:MAG: acyltransferase [Clostridiales bacterium]|nr:acyltransferase [Clostridiales bacterium]